MHTIIHNDVNKTKCICVSNCLRKYVTPCGGYYWPTLVSLYDRSHAFNPFGLTDAMIHMIHKWNMHTELFFLHYFFCCCSPLPLPLTLDYCMCVLFSSFCKKHSNLIDISIMPLARYIETIRIFNSFDTLRLFYEILKNNFNRIQMRWYTNGTSS